MRVIITPKGTRKINLVRTGWKKQKLNAEKSSILKGSTKLFWCQVYIFSMEMAGPQIKVRQFTDQIYHTYLLTWPKFLMYIRMYLLFIYFLIDRIAILKSKKFSSGLQLFLGIMRCQQTFWLSLLYKRHFFISSE